MEGSKSPTRRDWVETEAQMEGLALATRKDSSLLAAGGKLGVGGRCRRRWVGGFGSVRIWMFSSNASNVSVKKEGRSSSESEERGDRCRLEENILSVVALAPWSPRELSVHIPSQLRFQGCPAGNLKSAYLHHRNQQMLQIKVATPLSPLES